MALEEQGYFELPEVRVKLKEMQSRYIEPSGRAFGSRGIVHLCPLSGSAGCAGASSGGIETSYKRYVGPG